MVTLANQFTGLLQNTLNYMIPSFPKNREKVPIDTAIERVAVVLPYFIGDTIIGMSFLENLHRNLGPGTKLLIIGHRVHLNLLENQPFISGIFEDPVKLSNKKALLRKLNCDMVILLRISLPWGIAMLEAGTRYRIGFDLERFGLRKLRHWGGLLTHSASSGHFDASVHQISTLKTLMSSLGYPWQSITPQINPTWDDYAFTLANMKSISAPRIVLHASAGSPGKQWPLKYWGQLMEMLFHKYHASFIAVGTPKEKALYDKLQDRTGIPITNLCGLTTLRQSGAICQLSDLVLTLDTSIAHIAAAVGAPRLAVLYGPTNYNQWRPLTLHKTNLVQIYIPLQCRPCITRNCYHKSCTRYLTPERVMFHLIQMMQVFETKQP